MKLGLRQKLLVSVFASAAALAAAQHAMASEPPFVYGGLSWGTDRFAMDTVQVLPTYAGQSNVLHLAFGPNGDRDNRGSSFNSSFYGF